jgi:pyroglutamyl-peptidase
MKKILLTAFSPFGNQEKNSSLEIMKKLKKTFEDATIVTVKLPVIYDEMIYKNLLLEHRPDYVIMCGQAGGRKTVDLEKVAINYIYANAPDNRGVIIKGSRIIIDGPDAYFSTFPVSSISAKLESEKYPVRLSLSAGGFVCNFAFYSILHYAAVLGMPCKVGFIHFPYFSGQMPNVDEPALKIGEMTAVLEAIIQSVLE